ncbi:hypothetical protein GOP47_0013303 [Adiantum capillus-veneris]|uniref:Homeobox domain-containing protein n=1 Tax=Adiantum capillus-veneris TaxID=13818 RepID=A0A9D4UP74_ADICA|nr:hypothetical protein GOP47_0013303 [Adiantum capillus-veneris]
MAWRVVRGFGPQQMKLCKDEQSDQLVVGLIAPAGLPSASQDLRPLARKRCHQIMVSQRCDLAEDDDLCDELMNNANEKKRRLTVDQVQYLETSFNMDLKLEPERKALIAKQLGLRPRQVAIWFQNRRARWKNKQLEQDYEALKASYDAIVQENESMSKKNQAVDEENKRLQVEVARLTSLLGNSKAPSTGDARGVSPDMDSDSDSESALQEGEQLSSKSELASPTKSDAQSEMLDSSAGLGHPASQEAIAAIVDQPTGEISSFVTCAAVKLEADYRLLSPSEEVFINIPQFVNGLQRPYSELVHKVPILLGCAQNRCIFVDIYPGKICMNGHLEQALKFVLDGQLANVVICPQIEYQCSVRIDSRRNPVG